MRPITVIRAVQMAAVVATGWSLSLQWGDEIAAGKGPPGQWERHVVGATLLLLIGAIAMALTARKGAKPGRFALGISAACAAAALGVALMVRSDALDRGLPHVLAGKGWIWMAAGGCMSLGAVASALALRLQKEEAKAVSPKDQAKAPPSKRPQPKNRPKRKKKKR